MTFPAPEDPAFRFVRYCELMKREGFVVHPGQPTVLDRFPIGGIGQLDERRISEGVAASAGALDEMRVAGAAPPASTLARRSALGA